MIHNFCQIDCRHEFDPAGWAYGGTTSTTKSGLECQRWDSQTPHTHTWTDPNKFIDSTIAHNYCRNPNFLNPSSAWCHTMNPNNVTEACDIPVCGMFYNISIIVFQTATIEY